MLEVKDNYLSSEQYSVLKTNIESEYFPWYYNHCKIKPYKGLFNYQLVHTFYNQDKVNSDFFDYINPIINKLEPKSLIRIKANLNPVSHKLIEYNTHQDQTFDCKAAIYYLNDNDGYTMIGKEKVESKKNRIVLFKSDEDHYGTNSTNCNNRIVINFNYF